MNKPKSSFSIILNYLRNNMTHNHVRGITLKELGESAGVTESYLSQLELGKRTPSRATIKRLSQALTADSLLPYVVVERFLNGLLGRNSMTRNDLIAIASACRTTTSDLQNLGGFTITKRFSLNSLLLSESVELDGQVLTAEEMKLFKSFLELLRINRKQK